MGRVGGIRSVDIDGRALLVKSGWKGHDGSPLRENVPGADRASHGYTEKPQTPFLEGPITVSATTDVNAILNTTNATITARFANQTLVLEGAHFAGDGAFSSEEGELAARFEGTTGRWQQS